MNWRARIALAALLCAGAAQAESLAPENAPLGAAADRGVVLYFVATDCPICNRSFAEMRRLRQSFEAQHVAFWYVYPNQGESRAGVLEHQREFDAEGRARMDASGRLVALAGARVTPEVAVLRRAPDGRWQPAYVGRIDDRYVRIGLERPRATRHFAEQAIQAALTGSAMPQHTGEPVGCGIMNPQAPEMHRSSPAAEMP